MKKITLLILFIFCSSAIHAQQAFDCGDNTFYQVISGALKAYDPITGNYSEALHTHANDYNAGGYNVIDNFLYAINRTDKHLLRIGRDRIVDLGAVTANGSTEFGGGYAADVDADGNLWVFQNSGGKNSFHKITNLQSYTGATAPVFEIIEANDGISNNCADIVFINGDVYGASNGKIFKWELSSGTPVVSTKTVANLPSGTYGAAYTDTSHRLYVSNNVGGLYLVNEYESNPTATLLNMTIATNSNDGFKCANGFSPLDNDFDGVLDTSDGDIDGDGITNTRESNGVNPYGDTDGDGMYNYLDNDTSGNGDNTVQSAFDSDRDGIPNFFDLDSDNDGIYDIVEAGEGNRDTNNDGRYSSNDANYTDTNADGIADVFDPTQNGTECIPADTDGDGIYNSYDIDSDGDGIVDIIEGQQNNSYIGLSGNDADKDGIDDNFDIDTNGVRSGYINTDGTDTVDYLDTDSDNDGILDTVTAYDYNSDGSTDTKASGNDIDQDGLDDSFDQLRNIFDAENGGQTPNSFPIPPICEQYQYLGNYTSDGTPQYLAENDVVSQETLDMIASALPEGYPVPEYNPHYITSGYDSDLRLSEMADLWVTFVGEGAGYRNTLGFYTYDLNDPAPAPPTPKDITIIFPNVSASGSGGGLHVGNKVKLGTFPKDTGIGWVLLANAWSNGCVDTGYWQLHSNPAYNPETDPALQYHNVLLADPENERVILGFEDIRRDSPSCDQDFNDALFYITSNPYTAIQTENIVDIETATDVTSANNGGLESNGDLASLIAKRNFIRSKTNNKSNQKNSQKQFTKTAKTFSQANGNPLSRYFPITGAFGTETTYISSPDDLIGITNATQVFSIDYYQDENRVAAALATTSSGNIYDHSKTTCDRLNGSTVKDIRTVLIKKHRIVSTTIERASGETEHVLHFSVKLGASQNEILSFWNIGEYPEGDYMNFQIWGGSIPQVAHIANTIVTQFTTEKKLYSNSRVQHIPSLFVQKGNYKNGEITLSIVNKLKVNTLYFKGNSRTTELATEEALSSIIPLSGAYYEEITIDTGYLFDIGFSIGAEGATQTDGMYLADGPWGIDYVAEGTQIESFEINAEDDMEREGSENGYLVERSISVKGHVKETMNVFRNILAGELTLNVSQYDRVTFELETDIDVEVILVTKDLQDWNNRLRYTIKADAADTTMHSILFTEFTNYSNAKIVIEDIRSVVFSIQGDYQSFTPFTIAVQNLAFTNAQLLEEENEEENETTDTIVFGPQEKDQTKAINYPNPFYSTTTIVLPTKHQEVHITVIDMMGKTVQQEQLQTINNQQAVAFVANGLKPGVYQYVIRNTTKQQYKGSFLIQ